MIDVNKKISDLPDLISVSAAADRLGVHPKTVRNHFDLVRIGDRTLVRVSDLRAKITGGPSHVG